MRRTLSVLLLSVLMLSLMVSGTHTQAFAEGDKPFRVAVICFDPLVPDAGSKRQHELMDWWNDPHELADGFADAMREVSYGYADYQIVEWIDINEMPRSTGGQVYDPDVYYQALIKASEECGWAYWESPVWEDWGFSFDYDLYLSRYKIYQRVDAGEIDEVWIFTGPVVGVTLYETRMVGRNAYWCNSPGLEHNCRPFVVYGFNYERGVAEMVHDAGHRAESIMGEIYGWPNYDKPYEQYNDWEKFSVYDQLKPGKSGPGLVHFAPNSESDYDWANTRYVDSCAPDWENYPNLTGKTQRINCSLWNGDELSFLKWWFKLMPHVEGVNPATGKYNNWWIYYTLDYINDPPSAA